MKQLTKPWISIDFMCISSANTLPRRHRPERESKEPTSFSVMPRPPSLVSLMSHSGTASGPFCMAIEVLRVNLSRLKDAEDGEALYEAHQDPKSSWG